MDPRYKWNPDVDYEEDLWVCQVCDAHVHVDKVPVKGCPACGAPIDEAEAMDHDFRSI